MNTDSMTGGDRELLAAYLRRLAPIPERELAPVLALFRPAGASRGSLVLSAGDTPRTIGFLAAGLLRLFYLDAEGRESTKSFCAAPDLVAAYSALLLAEPARFFIEALEDSRLLVADFAAFRQATDSHPAWQRLRLAIAEGLFVKKERREAALLLDDAPTRYRRFLAEEPGLIGRVRLQHIASYLGVTPVSLSRIRARLRRDEPDSG